MFSTKSMISFACNVLAAGLSLSTASAQTEQAAETASADLIPRSVFFSHADRMAVRLSPDGQVLTFIAPVRTEAGAVRGLGIFKAPVSNQSQVSPAMNDISARFPRYHWTKNPSKVVFLRDIDGNENEQVYLLDINTGDAVNVTNDPSVKSRFIRTLKNDASRVIFSSNARDRRYYDYYTLNVNDASVQSLYENKENFLFIAFDNELRPRVAYRYGDEGQMSYFIRDLDKNEWKPFFEIPFLSVPNSGMAGANWEREVIYLLDSRGRDKSVLKEVSLKDGSERVLQDSVAADLSGVLATEDGSELLSVMYEYTKEKHIPLTADFARELAQIEAIEPGASFQVLGRTSDDRTWLLALSQDTKSVHYYIWNRDQRTAQKSYVMQPELDALPLQPMRPVVIKSRDDLNMVSYLTLPAGVTWNESEQRASRAVPMVLYVHGGPWVRDRWGYHPMHQWLANRGYAVLSVNYRGSRGFGAAFETASFGEWGRKMHDDLIDATEWAKCQGIAIPDRVAIMGASYGGYAALAGLTMTPGYFAASVSIVGVSNLVTMQESIPDYWRPFRTNSNRRMGADVTTEEGRAFLRSRSPLTYAEQARSPLLLGHGDQDQRVKLAESEQMAEALVRLNLPVTFARFRDEGHGLVRPQNRMSFYGLVEVFLAQHIGGRAEPLELIPGTTMNVPNGRDQIPGLSEAMTRLGL